MNIEAIYSDGTSEYRNPAEPKAGDLVTFYLRAYRDDCLNVSLISQDRSMTVPMKYDYTAGVFDYYKCQVKMDEAVFYYSFEIIGDGEHYFFDRVGLFRDYRHFYQFAIQPSFSTPDWAKGAVMYQIFVDRFCNGDKSNDVLTNEYNYVGSNVTAVSNWDDLPANLDVGRFYGGDLAGVRQKFNYLKSLGVEVIYFNPLFVSPSSHKYDIADYDYIDPHFTIIKNDSGDCLAEGDHDNTHASRYKKRVTNIENLEASNQYFADFVAEAHAAGFKVILDGVFNHCGSFNKWLNREKIYTKEEGHPAGAYESKDSPYKSYFSFFDENAWPDNHTYDGWWGFDTLPKLNYEGSEKLYNYIMDIGRKWVSPPYNCDGWRLDVAADLGHSEDFNHQFWRDFRSAVKEANPNAIILAEHYGNPSAWLQGDQWDTVMNYDAFMEPLSYYLTGMEKHSDEYQASALGDGERFKNTMLHFMARMKTPSLYVAMNQLSNHDHSRFLSRTNHVAGRVADLGHKAAEEGVSIPVMKLATMVQLTWPGAPTLYYGDEAGVCGFTDPDNRRTYPWGHENRDLIDFNRDMIMLHKSSTSIKRGSFRFLNCGKDYISYCRFNKDEAIVVAINSGAEAQEINVPAWLAGVPLDTAMTQIMITNELGYSIMHIERPVVHGNLRVTAGPYTGLVFKACLQ